MSDRDVRELAEEIASVVVNGVISVFGIRAKTEEREAAENIIAGGAEVRIRAFLAEHEIPRAAHVITKRRRGGGREGVAHYMVGPRRETAEEAAEDLDRYVGALGRERALQGEVASLRGALEEAWVDEDFNGDDLTRSTCSYCGAFTVDEFEDLVHLEDCALATNAGRLEAEVIRAATRRRKLSVTLESLGHPEDSDDYRETLNLYELALEAEDRAVDALLAARGGEG